MPARAAINGVGRIGRATLKLVLETPELELVAVNDLAPADQLAYLIRYDSAYGPFDGEIEAGDGALRIDGHEIRVLSEKDPARLPWADMAVDLVFECTGIFRTRRDLEKHLDAGARKVMLSAPAKEGDVPSIVPGVNHAGDEAIVSTASCTTNCITPVMEVMGRRIGVEKALMTTVHAYTSSQGLVDQPAKKWRRGRAAAVSFVPTTTGAAKATAEVLPELEGRFDGLAVRGPVPVGSLSTISIVTSRDTSVKEINAIFEEEAASERYRDSLGVVDEPIVSCDIIGDPRGSIVDLSMTQVVDGNLVRVASWYDNEWGYAAQMVREAARMVSD